MRFTIAAAGAASLFGTASAICHHGTYLLPRADSSGPSWGYNELEGPLAWHGLSEEYGECSLGKNQSPINIVSNTTTTVDGNSLAFKVESYPDGVELENLGTTLEVAVNGTLSLNGAAYELAQFHFHTPSEHRIDSEFYPMEVHFVFQSKNSTLAVVGVPIEIGCSTDQSPVLASVFENIDEVTDAHAVAKTGPLDFSTLQHVIDESPVYQYSGSLTTPPCTEGVAWNVVKQPIYIDYTTFNKVKGVMKFNSRYTQNAPGQTNLLENARTTMSE